MSGRSIGSGPACHLAAKFNPAGLILISPIKSVRDAARTLYGKVADYFIEERFDNFTVAQKVTCPTAIFHGIQDAMVPYQHSMELLVKGFVNAKAHMFLRDGMEHNRIDYINDIIKPLRYFLKLHQIHMKPQSTNPKIEMLSDKLVKNFGYVDKKALKVAQFFNIVYKSQYFNNFEPKFIPDNSQFDKYGEQITHINDIKKDMTDNEFLNAISNPLLQSTFYADESFDTTNNRSFAIT